MRLRPAISLDDLVDDFGGRKRRRRKKRRKGRRQEPERRPPQRMPRRAPPEPVREASRRPPRWPRAAMDEVWEDEPQLEPAPAWPEDPDVVDAQWEDIEVQGAPRRRARKQEWGPSVRMGRNLRIRAALGYRAAVIELKPGLYVVAELPDAVTRTEFGIAPLLAPLIVHAAKKAMDKGAKPADGGGALRLFRARKGDGAKSPAALPGPVAPRDDQTFLLAAPAVDWVDDEDVADVLGCEPCDRRRR